ncbi:MAG: hypothetical protein RR855_03390 [Comamonas sp.]
MQLGLPQGQQVGLTDRTGDVPQGLKASGMSPDAALAARDPLLTRRA